MIRKFGFVLLFIFFTTNFAFSSGLTYNKLRESSYSQFGIGYNIVSFGFIGIIGPMSNQFTNGMNVVSGLDFSYKRIHTFFRVTGSFLTEIKPNLGIDGIENNMTIEHFFPEISIGYDFKNDRFSSVIPYIGYCSAQSNIWSNNQEKYTEKIKCQTFILGIDYHVNIFHGDNKRFKKGKRSYENLSFTNINFSVIPADYTKFSEGLFYNFTFGWSINLRCIK